MTKEEKKEIGLNGLVVFSSKLRYNAYQIEERLQRLIENDRDDSGLEFPLGLKLHIHAGMGSKQEDPDRDDPGYLAKVFFTAVPYEKVQEKCKIIN